jgi:hypothetical protein
MMAAVESSGVDREKKTKADDRELRIIEGQNEHSITRSTTGLPSEY